MQQRVQAVTTHVQTTGDRGRRHRARWLKQTRRRIARLLTRHGYAVHGACVLGVLFTTSLSALAMPPAVVAQTTLNAGASDAGSSDSGQASLDHLLQILRDGDRPEAERSLAVARLLELDRPEADAELIEAINSEDAAVRRIAARGIAQAPVRLPGNISAALLDRVYLEEGGTLEEMAVALASEQSRAVTRELASVATDAAADAAHRKAAIVALGHRRTPEAAAALVQLVSGTQTNDLRSQAFNGLRQMTGLYDWPDSPDLWSQWWEVRQSVPRERFAIEIANTLANERKRLDGARGELVGRVVRLSNRLYRAAPENHPETGNGEGNGISTRTDLLVAMLSDPLPAMRLEAIELAERRLVDNQPITEAVREALRHRISDPSPVMRERVALMLRDLNDEQGAERIARRLQLGEEAEPSVQRAFLRVMARLPRAAAVKPALDALLIPELRNEAAGALAAAAEAQLLGEGQKQLAVRRVRQHIDEGLLPEPDTVTLLGRVGDELDWLSIARWLDVDDDRVKQAAAQAWRESSRSLQPLAQRASDPVIGYIACVAIRERGKRPETLVALSKNPPPQEQALAVWRSALVEMARRVSPQAVLDADAALEQSGGNAELRTQMLSAAIDQALQERDAKKADAAAQAADKAQASDEGVAASESGSADSANSDGNEGNDANAQAGDAAGAQTDVAVGDAGDGEEADVEVDRQLPANAVADPGEVPEVITSTPDESDRLLVALILGQSRARMHDGDLRTALTDVQRVRDLRLPLTPEQRDMRNRLVVRASLAINDIDRARKAAAALLRTEGLPADANASGGGGGDRKLAPEVIGWFVELAERQIAGGQKQQVPGILSALNALTGGQLPQDLAPRVAKVREAVTPATPASAETGSSAGGAGGNASDATTQQPAGAASSDGASQAAPGDRNATNGSGR